MMQTMHVQGPQIHQFNNVMAQPIPRSAFKRDFTRRSTFDVDKLIPIFVDEILPGDEVHLKLTAFCRLATPIKPIMDNLYMDTFWFFIPNRLVWSNWEKFQGQQINPGDSVDYQIPILDKTKAPLSTTGFGIQSIYDYFGLPTLVNDLDDISALYNRSYELCYNEWFRDENMQTSYPVPTGDGPDDPGIYDLRYRGKRKDYLTSGLPWPQKGDPVTISLGGQAPVVLEAGTTTGTAGPFLYAYGTGTPRGKMIGSVTGGGVGPLNVEYSGTFSPADLYLDSTSSITSLTAYADLAEAEPITINALRQAALYQQILELDARGGTRYVESLYSRFGVISPDFRLQRPELIGQGTSRINVYAVPQTAPTTEESPQGNLAAFGTNTIQGHGCRYHATEHGMILGICQVRADLTYQQGIPRMFTRRQRLDFYEPLLNGLGEQAVLNREIYAQGTSADTEVFCYQERFAEYRFKQSEVTGKFRSTAPDSLDIWHLSQEFGSLPALGDDFIKSNTPIARVLAVPSEPAILFDAAYDYTHVRPMPMRSNPGIDRL